MAKSSKTAGVVKARRMGHTVVGLDDKGRVISKKVLSNEEIDRANQLEPTKLERYGVKILAPRPRIKPVKALDLSELSGRVIVESATNNALRAHKNTFKKLADM